MRKSKVKTLIGVVITLSILFVGTAGGAVYLKQQVDENKTAYDKVALELRENQRTVYVTMADPNSETEVTHIKAGTILEENVNVEKKTIYSGIPDALYITEDDLGKPLINTVPVDTPILSYMIAHDDVSETDREYEVRVANVMTSQADNDLIDIRILFPNGKDYAIVTKKRVQNLNTETASFTCLLDEEEILRMAAATIDAFTVSGTYIYTTRYTEDVNYTETIPTYPVRQETVALMREDPNILEVAQNTINTSIRENLERSLSSLNKAHVTAVTSGWNVADNAGSQVIMEGSASMEDDGTGSQDTIKYNWNFESEASDLADEPVTE